MTERARAIFAEIYHKFDKDGKMDAVGAASFIKNTTKEG